MKKNFNPIQMEKQDIMGKSTDETKIIITDFDVIIQKERKHYSLIKKSEKFVKRFRNTKEK